MNVLSRTIAILITMATLGNCAHATTIEDWANLSEPFIMDLSERDYLTAGDNGLTYDVTTGLEWLDFSYTLGNSINDTELESFYGDFRWATSDEVSALLLTLINGTIYENSPPAHSQGPGHSYIYIGRSCVTNESPCPLNAYGNTLIKFLQFFSDDYNDIDERASGTWGIHLLRGGSTYDEYHFLTGINKMPTVGGKLSRLEWAEGFSSFDQSSDINKREANPVAGSWLVRQAATSIPEPSTLVIFTLGLNGLASRRFSKKS